MQIRLPVLLAVGLAWALPLASAQEWEIESRLFRGTRDDGKPLPEQAVIVKSFSDPIFLPAPPKSFAAEADLAFIGAVRSELRGVYKLSLVQHLSTGRMTWDGQKDVLTEAIVLDGALYPIVYRPKKKDRYGLTLQIEVSRHSGLGTTITTTTVLKRAVTPGPADGPKLIDSAWGEGVPILNMELAVAYDDPIVLGFPVNGHIYFLSLKVREKPKATEANPPVRLWAEGEGSLANDFYVPSKPRRQVVPTYPEACKQDLIEGTVTVFVRTDDTGNVQSVRIWRKAHPELDKSAVEALKQWSFEPRRIDLKSVPAAFFMAVDFRLPAASAAAEAGEKKDAAEGKKQAGR
jgi:TonB family protein